MKDEAHIDEPIGIAAADAVLGRPFPLPTVALPLTSWVDITAHPGGAEVSWNLDISRPGSPGRLALYAGATEPPARDFPDDAETAEVLVGGNAAQLRVAPLEQAEPALRPVRELSWRAAELYLRLTAQGPWDERELLRVAGSVGAAGPAPRS